VRTQAGIPAGRQSIEVFLETPEGRLVQGARQDPDTGR
jgi:hypothetical protein